MTREKAKEILISTLRDINSDDDGFEYTTEQFTEAMLIAIESLSKHSLPSDLEEAAVEWCKRNHKGIALSYDGSHYLAEGIDAFKAGAEWQREQDQSLIELAEDHAMLAGMNKMKEEMMEKAEECELYWDGDFLAIDLNMAALGYSERDKVKVIVVPEEK